MCTKQNRLFAKLRLATSTMSSVGKEYRRPPTLSTTSCECRQGLSFVQGVAHSSAEPTGVNRMVSAFAISLLRTGRPGPLLTNGTPHKYHNAPGVGAGLNNGFVSLFLASNDYAGFTGTSKLFLVRFPSTVKSFQRFFKFLATHGLFCYSECSGTCHFYSDTIFKMSSFL